MKGIIIKGTTKLLGVMGDPIGHSLSPVMHNRAIAALGVDYVYVPLPVKAADLETAIRGLAAIGMQGFNVTIPHKQAIVPFLSDVTELAQAVGAVNTVWWNGSGWSGTNTDVAGFLAPLTGSAAVLPRESLDWSLMKAVILGNGGAARAVVAGCYQLGVAAIQVVGRHPDKLAQFQQSWQAVPWSLPLTVHPWEDLPELVAQADLLVNTTPIGMTPHPDQSPLTAAIAAQIKPSAIVYDLIYTPQQTQLLQQAQAQGATAIGGVEMLVQQGAVALERWLNRPVPVATMRQALLEALAT
ncbi:shikimate dehydrogenase [Trichothermofontia sp.]